MEYWIQNYVIKIALHNDEITMKWNNWHRITYHCTFILYHSSLHSQLFSTKLNHAQPFFFALPTFIPFRSTAIFTNRTWYFSLLNHSRLKSDRCIFTNYPSSIMPIYLPRLPHRKIFLFSSICLLSTNSLPRFLRCYSIHVIFYTCSSDTSSSLHSAPSLHSQVHSI